MGKGVAGTIIDSYCGSFPHSLRLAQVSHRGTKITSLKDLQGLQDDAGTWMNKTCFQPPIAAGIYLSPLLFLHEKI